MTTNVEDDVIEPGTGKGPPVLEDQIYPVVCRSVTSEVMEQDRFDHPNKLRFKLEVKGEVDDNGEPVFIDPLMNRTLTDKGPGSTLYKFAVAFGVLRSGEIRPIKMSEFVGREARAFITTAEEGGWPRVKEIMPAIKNNGSRPSGATTAASPRDSAVEDVERHLDEMEAFWKEVDDLGLARKEVTGQAKFTYDKEPFDLTKEERDSVIQMVAGK